MQVDVDFSLALNDRTGKLFLGRDIIAALGDRVGAVRYGRLRACPAGHLARRIAGRLTHEETLARVFRPALLAPLPAVREPHPTLHLDPLSVVRHRLESRDIVLCHDVGPVTHPQYYAPKVDRLYAHAYGLIRQARPHMVFVSKTSQREFHRLYGEDYASSEVIYIPTRPGVTEGPEQQPAGIEAPFLLTVGSIGDRKNQARCIAAFAASGLAGEGWRYVLVGGDEPGAGAARQLAQRTPGVTAPGYATDAELRWLYRHASGFVLMSLMEGFGMPVIEATEYGLPCLVSAGGILTEIGGATMLEADPLNVTSIAAGMRAIAGMSAGERARRVAAAAERLGNFEPAAVLGRWRSLIGGIAGAA
ncbi:glycosyltransferase [Camelimonas lactis]|uniref:Glycosyltransferase involved in cell wall biosynthesis n=1 Tax=Camelimonas lactis TaxID=659006 RepID=A0A4R2GS29_9HYPH|nr:glycosyltransferase [Camelimonas lactis]TCO12990.1 glycosyltransferase involved in cell wall biosynthesis [Camelimonas lactis]